jgi:hypothetical protein
MTEEKALTPDEASGAFDTSKYVTRDGLRFVNRKALTTEEIQKLADAQKPKQVANRVLVPQSIIEQLTHATRDTFLELADAGIPYSAALSIAARFADLAASVVRLDEEVKELRAAIAAKKK